MKRAKRTAQGVEWQQRDVHGSGRALLGIVLGVLFLACRAAVPVERARVDGPRGSGAAGIDYRFALDEGLRVVRAEACFRGVPGAELVCGLAGGGGALLGAWRDVEGRQVALPVDGGRIKLGGVPARGCVSYAVDLAAGESLGRLTVTRRGDAVASNIALWLWRPPRWAEMSGATARFELPEGMQVSVPWPRDGEAYRLEPSAFAFYSYAALGGFELEAADVAGTRLEVAVLPGLANETRRQVVPWLQSAARMAAQPFGAFPRTRIQVVVLPAGATRGWDDDDPVPFATVTRGGGASALMVLASEARREALQGDWVAVHEFSHLLVPFLRPEDAWFSEGFATYYQEVLRVRAGVLAEGQAWRRLYEGASLGGKMRETLAAASATMHRTHAYKQVYWAGAAFALLADAELRRSSHGRVDLDSVLHGIAARTSAQSRPVSVVELVAELDARLDSPLFAGLMERWVLGPRWPDLSELYAQFGLEVVAGETRQTSDAKEVWIRDAIMRRPSADRAVARTPRTVPLATQGGVERTGPLR